MSLPSVLNPISPYLQRAREISGVEPVVSYYCTYYAVKIGLQLDSSDPQVQQSLSLLLDQLEKAKILSENGQLAGVDVDMKRVYEFGLKIFNNADAEERNSIATRQTAKSFMASVHFFQVLNVFGDLPSEVVEKIKYAKYKASEILKQANKTENTSFESKDQEHQENQPEEKQTGESKEENITKYQGSQFSRQNLDKSDNIFDTNSPRNQSLDYDTVVSIIPVVISQEQQQQE
ncbi:hypothetical protein BB560_002964 [Smittium megazygosporum]|uniref:Vta1/callose synthase N-terminal domain-containing protein n=1 Tax=Smittium megazygosporum TaxID=133381 RepID=A0A2T9ZDB3_9FUNG|nr:hypothetical protein BB560_002964 [Smittium megazygosporum]